MKTALLASFGVFAASMIGVAVNVSAGPGPARRPIRPQMTCGDFLRFDDEAKPEVVYWFARRSDSTIDVDVTDRMVPPIVKRCEAVPAASLSSLVRAETEVLLTNRPQSP